MNQFGGEGILHGAVISARHVLKSLNVGSPPMRPLLHWIKYSSGIVIVSIR